MGEKHFSFNIWIIILSLLVILGCSIMETTGKKWIGQNLFKIK